MTPLYHQEDSPRAYLYLRQQSQVDTSDGLSPGAGNRRPRASEIGLPMDGEPDRGVVEQRPFDAVADMRGNMKVVPRSEQPRLGLSLEQHLRRTLKDQDPFDPFLIKELTGGGRLTGRDDPLDPDVRRRDEVRPIEVPSRPPASPSVALPTRRRFDRRSRKTAVRSRQSSSAGTLGHTIALATRCHRLSHRRSSRRRTPGPPPLFAPMNRTPACSSERRRAARIARRGSDAPRSN